MFAYCRTFDIKTVQYLTAQTRHARREDKTSQSRLREGAEAGACLSWSIDGAPQPDYGASFKALKKAKGASERKGAKLGVHMLVGVSPEWIAEAGDVHDPANPRNQQLLDVARSWADTWSNGGCYAARLDLDENGSAVVDLLIAPTEEQRHKSGRSKLTISANKALEAMALKHTGSKSKQYSALNTDWAEYAREHLDQRLTRGRSKSETGREHIDPDRYRAMMGEAEAARQTILNRESDLSRREAAIQQKEAAVAQLHTRQEALSARLLRMVEQVAGIVGVSVQGKLRETLAAIDAELLKLKPKPQPRPGRSFLSAAAAKQAPQEPDSGPGF